MDVLFFGNSPENEGAVSAVVPTTMTDELHRSCTAIYTTRDAYYDGTSLGQRGAFHASFDASVSLLVSSP